MVAPALLFAVGTGMQAGSSLLDAFAADAEGKLEQKLAERNAAISERNAKAVLLKAKFDQLRQVEEAERIMGELEVAIGASGIRGDVGAPMRLLAEQAEELQLDNLLIGEAAQTEAATLRDQAMMLRLGGKFARRRGKMEMAGSLLRGFGQAASGYGRYKSLFSQPKSQVGVGQQSQASAPSATGKNPTVVKGAGIPVSDKDAMAVKEYDNRVYAMVASASERRRLMSKSNREKIEWWKKNKGRYVAPY